METLYQFLMELDKLKSIYRRAYVTDASRNENSAEHSWHVAIAILAFKEQCQLDIDLYKALKMALIHDLCEIDAGDVSIYDQERASKLDAERACIQRLSTFSLPFAAEIADLWEEYEAQETPESHWVKVADRLLPFMMNLATAGKRWREHGITKSQVIAINQVIHTQAPDVFAWMLGRIDHAVAAGWLVDA